MDLYLVHNPASIVPDSTGFVAKRDAEGKVVVDTSATLEQSWKVMEQQVKLGKTKAIGISNFSPEQVDRICKVAEIKPANHQVLLIFPLSLLLANIKSVVNQSLTLLTFTDRIKCLLPTQRDEEGMRQAWHNYHCLCTTG